MDTKICALCERIQATQADFQGYLDEDTRLQPTDFEPSLCWRETLSGWTGSNDLSTATENCLRTALDKAHRRLNVVRRGVYPFIQWGREWKILGDLDSPAFPTMEDALDSKPEHDPNPPDKMETPSRKLGFTTRGGKTQTRLTKPDSTSLCQSAGTIIWRTPTAWGKARSVGMNPAKTVTSVLTSLW